MLLNKDFKSMLVETFGETVTLQIEKAYDLEPVRGLRINNLKSVVLPFFGKPSVLNPEVYIPNNYSISVTHPFHHAGCYYIQDPSASTPVLALDLNETDTVLDMCAAPGGKSTYILSKLNQRTGFLVSNDIDFKRNQKLVHNMDRWGHENVVVISNDTSDIAKEMPSTFDKVLLDAPCSGEGLYRRDREFSQSYRRQTAFEFAKLQQDLIENAYTCIKNGGILVYSTCTLNTIENEGVIQMFLDKHPECYLEDPKLYGAFDGLNGLGLCKRYFPNEHGEGHFIAKIRIVKPHESINSLSFKPFKESTIHLDKTVLKGMFKQYGDTVFGLYSRGFIKTKLNVTRDGVLVGSYKKSHFEFEHAISQSVGFSKQFKSVELTLDQAYKYLNGQQIETNEKGLFCVSYQGYSLGFAKGTGIMANNRYPKGLRNKFENYAVDDLIQ